MSSAASAILRGPRACSTCAKAKSRCIPGPNDSICERCFRLNKTCSSQTPAPARQRKTPRPTKVAELERRLEDLTSRLESVQHRGAETSPQSSPSESGERGHEGERDMREHMQHIRMSGNGVHPFKHLFPDATILDKGPPTFAVAERMTNDELSAGSSMSFTGTTPNSSSSARDTTIFAACTSLPSITTPPSSTGEVPRDAAPPPPEGPVQWPEGDEAQTYLDLYRAHITPLYPFVIIPPHMTAEQLRAQRPFTWKAVMVEGCLLDGPRQMVLGDELVQDVAVAAITKPKKTLDLLQGLQILLVWYLYNLNSFQITNLLFLTRSIAMGLGFTESQAWTKQTEHTSGCLEQMRAFAGTYYLVTSMFTTNKKPDALMNTAYIEACCRVLENKKEYPTDEAAVWLVRGLQLAQSISMTPAIRMGMQTMDLPLPIVIKGFKQQLQAFRNSLPQHLRGNDPLQAQLAISEIQLYEIGLSESSGLAIADQLECLWACAAATKSFFATRFAEPVTDLPRFTCISSFDLVFAFLTCLKLILFNAPGWDTAFVRRELAFDQLLARQAMDMEEVVRRRNVGGAGDRVLSNDPIFRLARKVGCLSLAVAAELNDQPAGSGGGGSSSSGTTGSGATPLSTTTLAMSKALARETMRDEEPFGVADATQDIMQDLEMVWEDMTGMNDWGALDAREVTFTPWGY